MVEFASFNHEPMETPMTEIIQGVEFRDGLSQLQTAA